MWEYVSIWHRANWVGSDDTGWEPDGWDQWVLDPVDHEGPPSGASELEALNYMGQLRWELVHVENVSDAGPPGDASHGLHRRFFILKRPLLGQPS